MSNKPEFVTALRLPKGSVWKVKSELVGRDWNVFPTLRKLSRE
jgi:hypothetical protein